MTPGRPRTLSPRQRTAWALRHVEDLDVARSRLYSLRPDKSAYSVARINQSDGRWFVSRQDICSDGSLPDAPSGLTCDSSERGSTPVDYFDPGDNNRSIIQAGEARTGGDPARVVSPTSLLTLRPDATVYAHLDLVGSDDRGYVVEGWEACPASRMPATTSEVDLQVGHCWIEPIRIRGRAWDLLATDQYGTGEGLRTDVSGSGIATQRPRIPDQLDYVDDAGARLILVPIRGPRALARSRGCD